MVKGAASAIKMALPVVLLRPRSTKSTCFCTIARRVSGNGGGFEVDCSSSAAVVAPRAHSAIGRGNTGADSDWKREVVGFEVHFFLSVLLFVFFTRFGVRRLLLLCSRVE